MRNLKFMLLVARYFGFNVYLYRETGAGFVATPCRSGICFCILNLLLFGGFAAQNVLNPANYISKSSSLVVIGGKVIMQFGYLDLLVILVHRTLQSRFTIELLNTFRSVDKQLAALGVGMNADTLKRDPVLQILLLSIVTLGCCIYSLFAVLHEPPAINMPMLFGHLAVGVSANVIACVFYVEVYELRYRLYVINLHVSKTLCDENLHQLRPALGSQIINVKNGEESNHRKDVVTRIGLIYDDLHSISLKISHRYKIESAHFADFQWKPHTFQWSRPAARGSASIGFTECAKRKAAALVEDDTKKKNIPTDRSRARPRMCSEPRLLRTIPVPSKPASATSGGRFRSVHVRAETDV
uniref:Gustatory receptor n=1 Tax=Anopheles farauti TaxID=69004 RepID=A0A182QH86_9DIPT